MATPGSEVAPTSELSDAAAAETSSVVQRRASEPSPRHHQLQQQQATVVIMEQPPTPPSSLPLIDGQSAGRARSADRLSPRQPVVTSDSLPPVAEEDVIVADDSAAPPADDVFSPTTGNDEDELDVPSETGSNDDCLL